MTTLNEIDDARSNPSINLSAMELEIETKELTLTPFIRTRVERRARYHLLRHSGKLSVARVFVRPVSEVSGYYVCTIHGEFSDGRRTSVRCTDLSPMDATVSALILFDLRVRRGIEGRRTHVARKRDCRRVGSQCAWASDGQTSGWANLSDDQLRRCTSNLWVHGFPYTRR